MEKQASLLRSPSQKKCLGKAINKNKTEIFPLLHTSLRGGGEEEESLTYFDPPIAEV